MLIVAILQRLKLKGIRDITQDIISRLLQCPLNDLDWLPPCSPGKEEVEDPRLGHHIHRAGGKYVPVILLVMRPGVKHGGPKHC